MLIDWFTVGAQALNFLILVGLMRRFLYQPVLHAIDAREKRIAAELAEAAAQKAAAGQELERCRHQQEAFDQQRAALLAKATEEAKAERQRLIDDARKAADAVTAERQAALRSEALTLNEAVKLQVQQGVFALAGQALGDLASTSLEQTATEVFNRRLRELAGAARETLGTALKATPEAAVVRSAFELPAEQRVAVQRAVNETFSADLPLRFETAPQLIAGIELTAHGQKVAWSISDYLAGLERKVDELLKPSDQPVPPDAGKTGTVTPAGPERAAA